MTEIETVTEPVEPRTGNGPQQLLVFVVLGIFGLVCVFVVAMLIGRMMRFGPQHGMVLQSPRPAMDFQLTSHQGQEVSLSDFRGEHAIHDDITFVIVKVTADQGDDSASRS